MYERIYARQSENVTASLTWPSYTANVGSDSYIGQIKPHILRASNHGFLYKLAHLNGEF